MSAWLFRGYVHPVDTQTRLGTHVGGDEAFKWKEEEGEVGECVHIDNTDTME